MVQIQKRKSNGVVPSFLKSPIVFGSTLFAFFVAFPPFDDYADVNLAFHMLQHVIIIVAGVMISYHLFKVFMDRTSANRAEIALSNIVGLVNRTVNRKGYFGILFAGVVIGFWHIPYYWDLTVGDPSLHVIEHFLFLLVGLFIGMSASLLGGAAKALTLIAALSAHMYGGFVLYILNTPIYSAYSLPSNQQLGFLMVIADPFIFFSVFFLLVMQSHWSRQPRGTTSFLSRYYMVGCVLLILLFAGYFGMTFVQLSYAVHPRGTVVVYIEGSALAPFHYYSPRNITIVLGTNSTVTWLSESYSTDTATSYNGVFSSPNISPGQSWSYTFSSPGVYKYYCIYHPFMTGIVKVLP